MTQPEPYHLHPAPENPNGNLSENAVRVLKKRYLSPGESSWHDVVLRVATHVASAERTGFELEEWRNKFYSMLFEQEFIPNSPTLRNAGTPSGQLSACFVIGPEGMAQELGIADPDDLTVMNHLKMVASEITKSGGGVGVHYGAFRPKGSPVRKSAHGQALGPVSFMESLNDWTRRLTQAGFREAAMMSMLPVSHPDVIEFIRCKTKEGAIHNTNISVAVTHEFMSAVKGDGWFEVKHPKWQPTIDHFPEDFREHVKIVPEIPSDPTAYDKRCFLKARAVFDLIAEGAHKNGEPGMFFIDTENDTNPWHLVGVRVNGTNPCGEEPLPDFGTCNLGHVVLGNCVTTNDQGERVIDYDQIMRVTRWGVRFLDNIISTNNYPTEAITRTARKYRNIGLGVVGWADLLHKLGVPYGSDESIALAHDVGGFINATAHAESAILYYEKGGDPDVFAAVGRRNLVLMTVAPTGTTSQLVDQFGGGIEPFFGATTWRYDHVHPEGYEFVIPDSDAEWFRSALNADKAKEVTPTEHVLMQAAWQESVDAAISKTINLPHEATVEDVKDVYLLAYATGCKGITVYRGGSRQVEVLSTKKKDVAFDPTLAAVAKAGGRPDVRVPTRGKHKGKRVAPERPKTLSGVIRKQKAGADGQKVYVTVGVWDGRAYEVFVNPALPYQNQKVVDALHEHLRLNDVPEEFVAEQMEKAKGRLGSEKLTRLISLLLRHGLKACQVASGLRDDATSMYDPAALIASVLDEAVPCDCQSESANGGCPECGGVTRFESGCKMCTSCDWSKCG